MDAATRVCHETVIRLLKGALRAYETWFRLQLAKDSGEPSTELPIPENGKVSVR